MAMATLAAVEAVEAAAIVAAEATAVVVAKAEAVAVALRSGGSLSDGWSDSRGRQIIEAISEDQISSADS